MQGERKPCHLHKAESEAMPRRHSLSVIRLSGRSLPDKASTVTGPGELRRCGEECDTWVPCSSEYIYSHSKWLLQEVIADASHPTVTRAKSVMLPAGLSAQR